MIPAKYEAMLSAEKAARAERSVRRLMRISPRTKISFQSGSNPQVHASARPAGMGRGQGELQINTRRSGSMTRSIREVLAHERAHLTPKRNTVRLRERLENPERLGREEGRADYLSGRSDYGNPFPKDREKTESFNRGYAMVQRRMTRAGTKTQLNKRLSAFGITW